MKNSKENKSKPKKGDRRMKETVVISKRYKVKENKSRGTSVALTEMLLHAAKNS